MEKTTTAMAMGVWGLGRSWSLLESLTMKLHIPGARHCKAGRSTVVSCTESVWSYGTLDNVRVLAKVTEDLIDSPGILLRPQKHHAFGVRAALE